MDILFNKIVKKLLKNRGKIIFQKKLFSLFGYDECEETHIKKMYKITHELKSKKILLPLKNGVYVVADIADETLNEIELLEKYYFPLLKQYIKEEVGSEYFVSGKKALEIHLKDFSIPEKIVIMNKTVDKKITLQNHVIIFKTYESSTSETKSKLFTKIKKHTIKTYIYTEAFTISSLELALLETCYISHPNEGVDLPFITKAIKKYGKHLRKETFHELATLKKFTMSFNRLKEISKHVYPPLSESLKEIMTQHGLQFIGIGLRKV